MARNTEPQLTVDDDATVEQRQALEPFLGFVRKDPAIVIEALRLYDTDKAEGSKEPLRRAIGIVRLVLKTGADLEALPDDETARAMRTAIEKEPLENRRPVRLATFVLAVQTWQEQQQTAKQPEELEQHATTSVA